MTPNSNKVPWHQILISKYIPSLKGTPDFPGEMVDFRARTEKAKVTWNMLLPQMARNYYQNDGFMTKKCLHKRLPLATSETI